MDVDDNKEGADAPDSTAADAAASTATERHDEIDVDATVPEWKFLEAKETRDKAKAELREVKRMLQERDRADEAAKRERMEKKEQYADLLARLEKDREALDAERADMRAQISKQLQEKQYKDLKRKIIHAADLAPEDEFLLDAVLQKTVAELPGLIDDVDASDIDSLTFREASKKSVDTAVRHMRKQAPRLFNQNTKTTGGDVPAARSSSRGDDKPRDYVLPQGIDENDPRVAQVLKQARGR